MCVCVIFIFLALRGLDIKAAHSLQSKPWYTPRNTVDGHGTFKQTMSVGMSSRYTQTYLVGVESWSCIGGEFCHSGKNCHLNKKFFATYVICGWVCHKDQFAIVLRWGLAICLRLFRLFERGDDGRLLQGKFPGFLRSPQCPNTI